MNEIEGVELVAESYLTREQEQRIEALKTAGAITSTSGSLLTMKSTQRLGVLPGDLVRVAQWIVSGDLVIKEGADEYTHRDKRSGWVTVAQLKKNEAYPGAIDLTQYKDAVGAGDE